MHDLDLLNELGLRCCLLSLLLLLESHELIWIDAVMSGLLHRLRHHLLLRVRQCKLIRVYTRNLAGLFRIQQLVEYRN